jgi:hypothetical protein
MTFTNRTAGFVWAFAFVWLSLLVAFTVLQARDGPPEGYSPLTVTAALAVFWIAGLALGGVASAKPCYVASVDLSGATLLWQYPFRRIRITIPLDQIEPPEVVDGRDSDGDAYFFARLTLPALPPFDLVEGRIRSESDGACRAFREEVERLRGASRAEQRESAAP